MHARETATVASGNILNARSDAVYRGRAFDRSGSGASGVVAGGFFTLAHLRFDVFAPAQPAQSWILTNHATLVEVAWRRISRLRLQGATLVFALRSETHMEHSAYRRRPDIARRRPSEVAVGQWRQPSAEVVRNDFRVHVRKVESTDR